VPKGRYEDSPSTTVSFNWSLTLTLLLLPEVGLSPPLACRQGGRKNAFRDLVDMEPEIGSPYRGNGVGRCDFPDIKIRKIVGIGKGCKKL